MVILEGVDRQAIIPSKIESLGLVMLTVDVEGVRIVRLKVFHW